MLPEEFERRQAEKDARMLNEIDDGFALFKDKNVRNVFTFLGPGYDQRKINLIKAKAAKPKADITAKHRSFRFPTKQPAKAVLAKQLDSMSQKELRYRKFSLENYTDL